MGQHALPSRLLTLFTVLCMAAVPFRLGKAQMSIMETNVQYVFGEAIEIEVQFQSELPIQKAQLFLQADGENLTRMGSSIERPGERAVLSYTASERPPLRAFSIVNYWFELTLADQEEIVSDRYSFKYIDNRFEWQSREEIPFQVHWQAGQGDSEFGQELLNVAHEGQDRVQSLLPLEMPEIIRVYAYSNAADMRDTLGSSRKNWVGAHADPDLGVMVVSLPSGPEQQLDMERQVPHELMHIMLYQTLGESYVKLPVWLNEGLASIAELYPNPDYLILLNSAQNRDSLLPIASLCNSFPREASGTFLAYAEATSFTRYIHNQFGTSGLESLIETYEDGVGCERGVQVALGSSLSQLENQWRVETLGDNIIVTAGKNLLPWLIMMGLILLVPLGVAIGWRQR